VTNDSRKSVYKDIESGDLKALHRAVDMVSGAARGAAYSVEVNDYAQFIDDLAQSGNGLCHSRSAPHAAIVVEAMFRYANSSIEILTGDLDIRIYGMQRIIDAALTFVSGGPSRRIDILSEQAIDTELHPMFKTLGAADLLDRVTYAMIPEDFAASYLFRFVLADHCNYRFQRDRSSFDSLVEFGSAARGEDLHRIFTTLKSHSVAGDR
jgi:hypothetical protein